ncbi:MAG TPA: sugar ABC transporter permease [Thermotogota bacterium]|nr:sugar ABC transporter permease [Thermotogota bacterium]
MKNNLLKKFNLRTYMMIIALVLIWGLFSILTQGTFLTARNMSNLFRQSVFTSILGIGMAFVIFLGEIDLSVGSVVGLTGGIIAILDVWNGMNPALSITLTLGAGLLIGLWQGFWVAYMKVPSFIVTLAGLLIFRGILVGITEGTTIGPLSNTFKIIGKSYLNNTVGILIGAVAVFFVIFIVFRSRRNKLKYQFETSSLIMEIFKLIVYIALIAVFVWMMNSYRGVPVSLLFALVALVIFSYLSRNTVFGRSVYAIGGNKKAAALSGINIKKVMLLVFVINGFMAALAGILLTSRLNAASVQAGTSAEMDAIGACVIGGASLAGGIGSISGAVVGAIVMASLDNGMSLMNMPMFWQSIIKGFVILFAVWLDMATKNKNKA